MEDQRGKVYLIGAGPGDPGLFTIKGKAVLERADVVIYDYLASRDLLDYCRPDAERVYVGKQAGRHTLPQDQINDMLVQKAGSGATVARLKGGDPFIFGRGGEEAEVLEEAGIPFEVVPGVTSAIAAPAYAGIPLTHRRYASSVAIVTGHQDPAKGESTTPWKHLAGAADTLVFLMGMTNLERIASQLMIEGKNPETPAAIIQWGTTPRQRTVTSTLGQIAAEARRQVITAPAIFVVGEVVSLRSRLGWFEKAPLMGRRILVTRSREQASELANRLRGLGADPVEFPTIRIKPPDDWRGVDRAILNLTEYDWLVFTSPNGVRFLLGRIQEKGGDIRDLKGKRIAAIGPGTAQAVRSMGVRVDLTPQEYRAEALVEAFRPEDVRGKRFLLPRAKQAREVLPDRLRDMGGSVDVVAVYETVVPDDGLPELVEIFSERRVHAVTFTSSSTVTNFVRIVGRERMGELLTGVHVACIGPVTARKAEEEGLEPHVIAREYTIEGLVWALVEHFLNAPSLAEDPESPGE